METLSELASRRKKSVQLVLKWPGSRAGILSNNEGKMMWHASGGGVRIEEGRVQRKGRKQIPPLCINRTNGGWP